MEQLRMALLQADLAWENPDQNRVALEKHLAALSGKAHIALLPEMFTTGFSMAPEKLAETMDGPTLQWMKACSQQFRLVVGGSIIIDEEGKYFNRFLWVLPNGQVGYYDKRHLFGYAGEDEKYSPGSKRCIASVGGWRLNLQICYDLRFPVWSRQQTPTETGEFDVLIYVANWPAKRALAWNSLLAARAIENQCYVIGLNRVGIDGNSHAYQGDSQLIDPLGNRLQHLANSPQVAIVTLEKEVLAAARKQFPFWQDGDAFLLHP